MNLLSILLIAGTAFAQTSDTLAPLAIITGPQDIAVGRTLVLDASASRNLGEETTYRWYREGIPQPISRTVEMIFTPERPGESVIRLVIRTTIDGEEVEIETRRTITAYNRKIVLLADAGVSSEKIAAHRATAAEAGVYLRTLQAQTQAIGAPAEEGMLALLTEQEGIFTGAQATVLWGDGIGLLQTLMRTTEENEQRRESLRDQTIILITENSLATLARTARGPFSVLRPQQIVITRNEGIHPLLTTKTMEEFLATLEQRDIDLQIVDAAATAVRPWNLLSSLVNYMLTHGIASQTIILLLMLPVIATLLAILKQVVGVTTFGLYTPSIVALSFLALGWGIGLALLLCILTAGYATRAVMRRWRLLHIPKVAIIITVVSVTLLALLGAGAALGVSLPRDTIFVLLIMSTLAETLLTVKAEEGLKGAIFGIAETILAALLCVFIVQWSLLQSLILAYPELVLLTIIVNIVLGRFTGLRLMEYFRFREVLRHLQEE